MSDPNEIIVISAKCMENKRRLSTGSSELDKFLGGGLPNNGLTELTGESGCGKSQLCKQLTLTVQYPHDQGGLEGGAIYICTEERFQSKRLYELIREFPRHYYKHKNNEINFGDNILIVHVEDFENLEKCLQMIPSILRNRKIKLIIIDSITAIFRSNYSIYEGQKRAKEIRSIGFSLYYLSKKYDLLVLCVNQVTHSIVDGRTVPALGLAWANLVTTRLSMTRNGNARLLQVVHSPQLPSNISASFLIHAHGISN